MGALSSCCSTEPAEGKETILENAPEKAKEKPSPAASVEENIKPSLRPPTATTVPGLSESDISSFKTRLENSMEVTVLLADGTKLTCDLKLNSITKTLIISCDTNVREIPLSELKAILHGREQLRRVETKAQLTDDSNCIALHMLTGNCIPIRFDATEDKTTFIEIIKMLK